MAELKAGDVASALARLDPAIRFVLLFGPDEGLSSERARDLAQAWVGAGADSTQIERLDGARVAAQPGLLADTLFAANLFGGKRAVRLAAGPRPPLAALEAVLAIEPAPDALLIVEAGELPPKKGGLRHLFASHRRALAAPGYPDQGRSLDALIDDVIRGAGLSITSEARTELARRLGEDRRQSRQEIEKLVAYAGPGARSVGLEDIEAIVGDASAREIDDVVDGVFAGALPRADAAFGRLLARGEKADILLGFALRHGLSLLAARHGMDASGISARDATERRGGLPFPRKRDFEAALNRWSSEQLERAIGIIGQAVDQARRHPQLGEAISLRALWMVALTPQRSG
jgi:DNA polymerase-3 subunit delta